MLQLQKSLQYTGGNIIWIASLHHNIWIRAIRFQQRQWFSRKFEDEEDVWQWWVVCAGRLHLIWASWTSFGDEVFFWRNSQPDPGKNASEEEQIENWNPGDAFGILSAHWRIFISKKGQLLKIWRNALLHILPYITTCDLKVKLITFFLVL